MECLCPSHCREETKSIVTIMSLEFRKFGSFSEGFTYFQKILKSSQMLGGKGKRKLEVTVIHIP